MSEKCSSMSGAPEHFTHMISRFVGDDGRNVLVDALREHKLVGGSQPIAEEFASVGNLIEVEAGAAIIEQASTDNDVYLILTGTFDVIVHGRRIARRGPTDHVGEMAAVEPTQRRSATVLATEQSVVLRVPHGAFLTLANRHTEVWRRIAKELVRRLEQRNCLITSTRDRIRVFIVSSAEALPIARAIQTAFQYDPFVVTVWTDGVFRASHYPIEVLESELDQSDFAIAIAEPDDTTTSRGALVATPRRRRQKPACAQRKQTSLL